MPTSAEPRPLVLGSETQWRDRIAAADAREGTVAREFRRLISSGVPPAAARRLAAEPAARGTRNRQRRRAA